MESKNKYLLINMNSINLINESINKIEKTINQNINVKLTELTKENIKLNLQYTLLLEKNNQILQINKNIMDDLEMLHKKNNILINYISNITSEYQIVNKENDIINELYMLNNLNEKEKNNLNKKIKCNNLSNNLNSPSTKSDSDYDFMVLNNLSELNEII